MYPTCVSSKLCEFIGSWENCEFFGVKSIVPYSTLKMKTSHKNQHVYMYTYTRIRKFVMARADLPDTHKHTTQSNKVKLFIQNLNTNRSNCPKPIESVLALQMQDLADAMERSTDVSKILRSNLQIFARGESMEWQKYESGRFANRLWAKPQDHAKINF